MLKSWLATISAAAILTVGTFHMAFAQNQGKPAATSRPAQAATLSEQEAYAIAKDAYVYAYPLVLTHTTLQKLSNFAESVAGDAFGPPNQFHHARAFPNPDDKIVIRENVDTLYSAAVLDLKAEPMVLSVPATDRYFHLPMLSLWTDVFAVPGTRTTGKNTARDFLVVGPQWRGNVPAGLQRPPVDAFWSVTAYDIDGYFIPNVLKRQAIGDRDKLVTNADGSLDLYIQADSPGKEKEANWLPVGKAPFTLLMRLYSPREEILEGNWTPPPVARQ